jgi:hypothetical protein
MGEEERQDLADFRRHAGLDLRHEIALKFLVFQAEHAAEGVRPRDKDPEEYLEEHQPS